MPIRVAQYIAQVLADRGLKHVFMVTGGGAMFLNDAFGSENRLQYVCNHHEQASAMGAEGYARIAGIPAIVNVTAGPGGVNAINGVFGAWTDSIPMIVVSGQMKRETLVATYQQPAKLRQLGDQEIDIISMVKGITKYAVMLTDASSVRYHVERALHLATTGRPGPVWIDVPIDIQSTMIEPGELRAYDPAEDDIRWDREALRIQCRAIIGRLRECQRPVILAGTGVRLAGAIDVFNEVIHLLNIPVTTAWTHDLITSDDPLFCGRQGTIGDRPGNFTVQNSDLLLVLGARLPIRQISYNYKAFARHAYKIQVDVDAAELDKPTVKPDMPVHADAKIFLEMLRDELLAGRYKPTHSDWLAWARERVAKYPPVLARHREYHGAINAYHFMEKLFEQLKENDIVACGDATACIVPFHVGRLKKGQRLFSNSGSASMGYDLPAAIGAAFARPGQRIICLGGDGSLQMNLQELQTIVHHQLPIKIFALSNGGYLSIRTTQKNFFGHQVGAGPESGVSFPDMVKIATAYGIPAIKIHQPDFSALLQQVLDTPGPSLGEVVLDQAQTFEPRLSSKQLPDGRMVTAPLEDMFPFLDRDEFRTNLLIPEWDA